MDERLLFVTRLLEGEKMAPLCAEFGISRKTGYKLFERYKDCGVQAFSERSHRAHVPATAFFPDGLIWNGTGFGTVVTCLAFKKIGDSGSGKSGMASQSIPSWNQIAAFLESMRQLQDSFRHRMKSLLLRSESALSVVPVWRKAR